jgi:hypothetical protein
MTQAHLRACPGCRRHVRATELGCPFCGEGLDDAFRAVPAPVPLAVRLSRAARFALGTGTLSLAAACGGATTGVLSPVGDAGREGGEGSGAADSGYEMYDANTTVPYGLPPPVEDGGINTCCPPYGGPAPQDVSK